VTNHNSPSNKNRPERALVERVAKEEALAAHIAPLAVLGMSRDGRAVRARRLAWRRILRETGCSIMGLAEIWGCYDNSIRVALPSGLYDRGTAERLKWRYGRARAAQIIAGKDPWTRADLAAWARVGGKRSAA
jgi:hypothetical protein